MAKPLAKLVSLVKPKRRWMQFSLGTMFVVVTVFCMWLAVQMNRAHRQRDAVAAIGALGGVVQYDYEFDAFGALLVRAEPPGPQWLTTVVGVDFLANVRSVSFVGTNATDDDLQTVQELPALEVLRLSGTSISDMGIIMLRYRPKLRELYLDKTQMEDPYVIGDYFPNLETLDLSRTPAGSRLKNLHGRFLRHLFLNDTQVGDASLRFLAQFSSLELLSIQRTRATDRGIDEFKEQRAKCTIIR